MDDGYGKAKGFGPIRDTDGNQVEASNRNPMIDSRVFTVELDDETIYKYASNIISKIDDKARENIFMIEIIENQSDDSTIQKWDGFINRASNEHGRNTLEGWKLLFFWKDGISMREVLKDLKEYNPTGVA